MMHQKSEKVKRATTQNTARGEKFRLRRQFIHSLSYAKRFLKERHLPYIIQMLELRTVFHHA
jgi:hypothetical protein